MSRQGWELETGGLRPVGFRTISLRIGHFSRALKDGRIWESHMEEACGKLGPFRALWLGGEVERWGWGNGTAEAIQSVVGQGWVSTSIKQVFYQPPAPDRGRERKTDHAPRSQQSSF